MDAATTTKEILFPLHNKFGHCSSSLEKNKHSQQQKCRKDNKKEDKTKFSVDCNSYDEMDATTTGSSSNNNHVKELRGSGGCKIRDRKLVDILRTVCIDALKNGQRVRLTGHSLGGSLATLLALDIVINFPNIPITNLDLWTFGAPQIADDLFFESAMKVAPRLETFVETQTHRYVTTSDKCKVDAVSEVAKNTLPSHKDNLHGKFIGRKLGGVHGHVVHLGEPLYLLTPEQYDNNKNHTTRNNNNGRGTTDGSSSVGRPSTTRSSFSAHTTANYLKSISRISRHHPLSTDLPPKIAEFLGEYVEN